MRRIGYLVAFVFVCLMVCASFSEAATYKYVDENGTIVMTSDKDSIPEKHRESAEEIQEDVHKDGFEPSRVGTACYMFKNATSKFSDFFYCHAVFVYKLPGFFFSHPNDSFAALYKVSIPILFVLALVLLSALFVPNQFHSKWGGRIAMSAIVLCFIVISYFLFRYSLYNYLEELASEQNLDFSQRTMYYLMNNIRG